MSDENDHTHRVVGGNHMRTSEGPRPTTYEPGDELTPTERELDAFPDRFEPLDVEPDETDETDASDDAAVDMGEDTGETEDAESGEQGDESEPATLDEAGVSVEQVEAAEYPDLRTLAREFDDVNGNWGEDRLRAELLERAED